MKRKVTKSKRWCPNLSDISAYACRNGRKPRQTYQISRSAATGFNSGPPKYEAGMLTTQPWHSVAILKVTGIVSSHKLKEGKHRTFLRQLLKFLCLFYWHRTEQTSLFCLQRTESALSGTVLSTSIKLYGAENNIPCNYWKLEILSHSTS